MATEEPSSLREYQPLVDKSLERIVMTALAREPAERFPSMDRLAADLSGWLAGTREDLGARDRKSVLRYMAAIVTLLLCSAAVGLGMLEGDTKRTTSREARHGASATAQGPVETRVVAARGGAREQNLEAHGQTDQPLGMPVFTVQPSPPEPAPAAPSHQARTDRPIRPKLLPRR